MKKLFVVLAAVAMIACVSTSCKKNCVCETPHGSIDYGTTLNKTQCDLLNIGEVSCKMQ